MTASVVSALLAACCFAGAAVLQQEAAQSTSREEALRIRLLLVLLRRPRWLAGIGLLVSGYALQAVALAFGPVALVQPIVVTELALAIPVAIWRRRRRPTRRDWLGIVAVLAGVAGFLLVASPAEGTADPDVLTWVVSLVPVGGLVAVLVAVAVSTSGRRRAMLLGAAGGASFGLLAVLTKATAFEVGRDALGTLSSWQPYALVAVGIAALVVSQSAYQAGPLAYSMPFVTVLEPLVAVLLGDTALDEQVRLSGGYLLAEALTAVVAVSGIVVLASSPTVLSIYEDSGPG
ncbi:MAG: DMT family transporter [Actinomycetota bacterium]|nr:DMT family transporter [Actinomycetota bacterium]